MEPPVASPEEALLLFVASRAASPIEPPGDRERQWCKQLIARDFDWRSFLSLAERQRAKAPAHRCLVDMGLLGWVSRDVLEALEQEREHAVAQYLRRLAELKFILSRLREDEAAPVVLKGIPLAHQLYTDPSVRLSRDIDLLCGEGDLERVDRRMRAEGYVLFEELMSREEYRAHHFHFIYTRGEEMHRAVEIHWSLRAPCKGAALDMRPLLARARPLTIDGFEISILDPEDAVWQLALSLAAGDLLDLRDLADLRRLALTLPEGAWGELARRARSSGTFHELSAALAVSERAFGPFLPPGARRPLRPCWSIQALLLPAFSAGPIVRRRMPFAHTRALAVYFFMRDGWKRRGSFLARLVFPSRSALIETRERMLLPRSFAQRARFHANGAWILLKVLGVIALSSPLSIIKQWTRRASGTALEHERTMAGIHHI